MATVNTLVIILTVVGLLLGVVVALVPFLILAEIRKIREDIRESDIHRSSDAKKIENATREISRLMRGAES